MDTSHTNTDTIGAEESVLIGGVSLLKITQAGSLGRKTVFCRGVLIGIYIPTDWKFVVQLMCMCTNLGIYCTLQLFKTTKAVVCAAY